MDTTIGKLAKLRKVMMVEQFIDPQHRDVCSKVKSWKMDESKQAMQLFDVIESEAFCTKLVHESGAPLGLHHGCAFTLLRCSSCETQSDH